MNPLYQVIARKLAAREACAAKGNWEWESKHGDAIASLIKQYLPSGSGFDSGTKLDADSTPERLIFHADFHHMDEHGYYDGWSEHTVIVTPSLQWGFDLRVTGRNRNQIKDYIAETFQFALGVMVEEYAVKEKAA